MFIHSHILSKTIVTRIQTEIGEVYTRFQIKTTHKLNHTLKGRHILIRQILGSTFPSPPPPPKGSSLWRRDNQWMLLGGAKKQLLVSYKRSLKLTRPGVGLGGGGGNQRSLSEVVVYCYWFLVLLIKGLSSKHWISLWWADQQNRDTLAWTN